MELNISDSARQSANNWSWSGHMGDVIINDAQKQVDGFRSNFESEIKRGLSDEQEAYLYDREKQFCALISEYANDQNRRSGENPSWVVAGPSKYNFSRFEKLQNRQRASAEDYERETCTAVQAGGIVFGYDNERTHRMGIHAIRFVSH